MSQQAIKACRCVLSPRKFSWVLFDHGTCVVVRDPGEDIVEDARRLLGEFGPVAAGSEAGDFSAGQIDDGRGWVVTGHHPDVFNFVASDETDGSSALVIGLRGRSHRQADAEALSVVHVEVV